MKTALIGPLQSGKSTLFAAISGRAIAPTGTMTIEEAIVSVPDERIEWLNEYYKPRKKVYASIDCLDIPGFNFNDEHGRAAARKLINGIRTVDLLVLVIRAFQNPAVPPYKNSVDPARDLQDLKTELLLSDLELVSTRIDKLEKQSSKPSKTQAQDKTQIELFKRLQQTIEQEQPISSAVRDDQETEMVKSLGFLTLKPMVVAVNSGEDNKNQTFDFSKIIDSTIPVIYICAELDYELSKLDQASRRDFMAELGISESAVSKFVRSCYSAMGLISFITVVHNELHCWPVREGTAALDAAGKVHTDIKRGFIRAETFNFEELKKLGDEKAVKAAGKIRLEGKDYIVRDGDIINFRFNV